MNRPSHGPKTADVAYFAKVCDIFAPRGAPPVILLGETEQGCNFRCSCCAQFGFFEVHAGAEFIRFLASDGHEQRAEGEDVDFP